MRRWTCAVAALVVVSACGDRGASEQATVSDAGPAVHVGADGGGAGGSIGGVAKGTAEHDEDRQASGPALQGAPEATPAPAPPQSATDASRNLPGSGSTLAQSMLIRTGNATIEVQSLDPAIARVRVLAQQLGGFVANTSVQGGRDQMRSATLELRIPAQRFDDAISGLSPLGRVEAVNVNAEDVGEEFVDLTARMENARRLEERLVRLLASATGKLQEVLAVERELARVREEIERHEGRIRYLRSRVAVSSLHVNLHEPQPLLADGPGENPIRDALRQAWRNFVGFTAAFIASLGVLVPLGVILGLLYLGWRRWTARPRPGTVPPRAGEDPRGA